VLKRRKVIVVLDLGAGPTLYLIKVLVEQHQTEQQNQGGADPEPAMQQIRGVPHPQGRGVLKALMGLMVCRTREPQISHVGWELVPGAPDQVVTDRAGSILEER
jgi:hypothetical protein